MLSFSLDLDFETANASIIVQGLNASVRPNVELPLRKRRRDPSPACFIVAPYRTPRFLPGIEVSEYITSVEVNLLDEGIDRYFGVSWCELKSSPKNRVGKIVF